VANMFVLFSAWGRYYNTNFLRFLPIFGEKFVFFPKIRLTWIRGLSSTQMMKALGLLGIGKHGYGKNLFSTKKVKK
jgi:hypothetical protein